MCQLKVPGGVQNINNAMCQPETHRGRCRCPVVLFDSHLEDFQRQVKSVRSVLSNPRSLIDPVLSFALRYVTPSVSQRLTGEEFPVIVTLKASRDK